MSHILLIVTSFFPKSPFFFQYSRLDFLMHRAIMKPPLKGGLKAVPPCPFLPRLEGSRAFFVLFRGGKGKLKRRKTT